MVDFLLDRRGRCIQLSTVFLECFSGKIIDLLSLCYCVCTYLSVSISFLSAFAGRTCKYKRILFQINNFLGDFISTPFTLSVNSVCYIWVLRATDIYSTPLQCLFLLSKTKKCSFSDQKTLNFTNFAFIYKNIFIVCTNLFFFFF